MKNATNTNLTDMQEAFLDALFELGGDVDGALKAAGYRIKDRNTVLRSLSAEIKDRAELYMAGHAVKSAMALAGVIDDPTALGNDKKIVAAKELLDRVGLVKQEKVQVDTGDSRAVVILPAKRTDDL